MTAGFRALTLHTRLNWDRAHGCCVEGAEGTRLQFATRRQQDDPSGHWQAEGLLLAALEMATFRSFIAYAHSAKVEVKSYESRAEATVSLDSGGRPRLVDLVVEPTVGLGNPGDVARARELFAALSDRCAVLAALAPVVRIVPKLLVAQATLEPARAAAALPAPSR